MKKLYILPDDLRIELKKPVGELVTNDEEICKKYREINGILVTVGDICTSRALECGKKPLIAIVDFKTKRKFLPKHEMILNKLPREYIRVKVRNNPGTISEDLMLVISRAFNDMKKMLIVVEGEEDLSVIPVIIYAPIGAYVAYGQPDEGTVFIKVDETLKRKAQDILKRMVVIWHGAPDRIKEI
ncbi:MAG: hypothetical protein DRN30_04980 [Thermoplasmata archaeon]|nr:MAG: hypothetical protein DRN30_04980 [Thermoplasmata archaeon]